MKRTMIAALLGNSFLMAQEPTSGAAAAATPSTPAPGATPAPAGDKGQTADGQPRRRAPKTNLLNIARGRLPLLFVHAIRFKETAGTNAEIAKKYATSVGKVFDIKKGRNFEYVTEAFKPSAEDVKAAQAWIVEAEKFGGDKGGLGDMVASYKVATPEEAKAQSDAITAARSKGGNKAQGNTAAPTTGAQASAPAGQAKPAGQPATADQKKSLVS